MDEPRHNEEYEDVPADEMLERLSATRRELEAAAAAELATKRTLTHPKETA